MTKDEAKIELKKILDSETDLHREVYCPEIKNYCRVDCIQYVKTTGEILYNSYETSVMKKGFYVNLHKGYCLRYMR